MVDSSNIFLLVKKRILYPIFLLFNACSLLGQTSQIDSLKDLLSLNNSPRNQVDILNEICWKLLWADTAQFSTLNQKAIDLAENQQYVEGITNAKINLSVYHNLRGNPYLALSEIENALQTVQQSKVKDYLLLGRMETTQKIRSFEDLDCWKLGRELRIYINELIRKFPSHGITHLIYLQDLFAQFAIKLHLTLKL